MKYRLVLERISTHHIHVDVGPQPLPDLRMSGKKRHRALDLRSPGKAQCAHGTRQFARVDQLLQHARGFKDRDASAAIIVCARALVIEMTTVDDLSRSLISAGNGAGNDRPVARANGCFHVCA